MPKTSQKRPKNGQIKKKKVSSFFWLETTTKKLYSGLKRLEMDLNALKCIQMHIPQKGEKIQKNGKKWPKIANNCKISEITKYGEKNYKIDKNVKNDKNEPKTAKNGQI